mgnify:CR=1 FL=1
MKLLHQLLQLVSLKVKSKRYRQLKRSVSEDEDDDKWLEEQIRKIDTQMNDGINRNQSS